MYKDVPFWTYISFILQNSETRMAPNLLFVNNRGLVNSILPPLSLFLCVCVCVCVYASAVFKRVLNEICGPPVDCSWPALGYLRALEGSQ